MDLPYTPRPGQQELVDLLRATQAAGGHVVVEAATGTGKTVAALVAARSVGQADGRKVVYATRTNSQQVQVVREHKALLDAGMDPGLLIPLMGRRQYCPLMKDDERFRDGTPEELGKLCRDAKRKAVLQHEGGTPIEGACPFYAGLLADGTGPVEALLREGGLAPAAFADRVAGCGSCPYEALKALLPQADMVVVPFVFLIDDRLRHTLVHWMGSGLDGVHVVMDEAHNLPAAARDHHSPRLTSATLQRAVREAEEYKDPILAGDLLATTLLHHLAGALHDLADDFIPAGGDDGRLPPGALGEALMERLRAPSTRIEHAARDLETWGDVIREDRRGKGRLPRSYLGSVGTFLRSWLASGDGEHAHLMTRGDEPTVEAFLLEPASVLGWLHEAASSVHMSGTLAPPSEHVKVCGLPETTRTAVFASPFLQSNLRVVGVHGVHRRWQAHQDDPRHAARQQEAARALLSSLYGKTGLFFPSHDMLAAYVEEGFLHGLTRPAHVETRGHDAPTLARLVEAFKQDPNPDAILVGVLGGRLTEGLDFPGKTMENLLVFGIPYPRPSARSQALIDHHDRVHDGKGWTYAVHNPVGRVLRQAVGRLVRGPDDRGTAVVLDERVVRFRGHLPGLTMVDDVEDALTAVPAQRVPTFVPAGGLQEGTPERGT